MKSCSLQKTIVEYTNNNNDDKLDIDSYIISNLHTSPLEEVYECFNYIKKHNKWYHGNLLTIYNDFINNLIYLPSSNQTGLPDTKSLGSNLNTGLESIFFYINLSYIPEENKPSGDWLTNPIVNCQISSDGDDRFTLLDCYGEPIPKSNPYHTYSIGNSSFREEDEKKAIKMLMMKETCAIVNTTDKGIIIHGLANIKTGDKVYTIVEQPPNTIGGIFVFPMERYHDDGINIIFEMYNELITKDIRRIKNGRTDFKSSPLKVKDNCSSCS